MKKNLSDYIVALVVILCSLVLLGALTYALSGRHGKSSDRTLEIDYPDVTGIKLHSQVRYAGADAGTVTNIRLLTFAEREAAETEEQKKNAVRVTITLLKDVPPIPSDVRASLAAETLLSEKFVALSAGTPTAPKLANGAILQGHSGGGLDGLFEAVGPLAESLPHLLATAEDLLKSMNPLLTKTGDAVDSVKVAVNDIGPRASKLLDGLKVTSDSADVAVKRLDKMIADADGPLKGDLEELKTSMVKIQGTLNSANLLLTHTDKNLDARLQELAVVFQNLKVVSTHAKAVTQALGEKPSRLIFSGKPQKLTSEEEILRSNKPVPAVKP
ncbi:Mammalian cell entry related domain protein [Chthoniobacter flavus Ellin428]|uniref:Mammalian cell entry related domain protein n=1 Tax=Chthoniobacter flavus Ellin428 TaxID=497964 RepID=B4D7N9_9BACT|nr:MlaD family protein [Chthoniobacter flavus]EDY17529.1 Mammalian cell entry related domain protein [Chthoniobacter flavus Ellin428]TCO92437.1 ABC-type transporter Mla subunit MlaD [Chthoniobacter flavus]